MSKKPKETISEKCNRLENEIKSLKKEKLRLDKQIVELGEQNLKIRQQKLKVDEENIALKEELFAFKSKKQRTIEDLIAEYDEDKPGIKEKFSNKDGE